MNKFIKYGAVAGGVMILVGIGMVMGSLAMGASPKRVANVMEERFRAIGEYGQYRIGKYGFSVTDDGVEMSAGDYDFSVTDDGIRMSDGSHGLSVTDDGVKASAGDRDLSITDNGVRVSNKDGSQSEWFSPGTDGGFEAGYASVSELKIQQYGGTVDIFVMDTIEEMKIKSTKGALERISYNTQRPGQEKLSLRVNEGEDYQIFIPADWEFESFEAEVTKGTLNGDGLQAYETELDTKEGTIRISQQSTSKLELDCEGKGSISWTAQDKMALTAEADCVNGTISLCFPKELYDGSFGYSIECENGTVNFPEFKMTGWEEKKTAGDSGMPKLKLEAVNGIIEVIQ